MTYKEIFANPSRPKYIVKFFEKEQFKYYNQGQFKLGTLEEYRATEKQASEELNRFTDEGEGVPESNIALPNGSPPLSFSYNNLHFNGTRFSGEDQSFRLSGQPINEFVFCASVGPYTKDLHRGIIGPTHAAGSPPYSNPKLTHFAVLDRVEFRDALLSEFRRQCVCEPNIPLNEQVFDLPVIYGDRAKHFPYVEGTDYSKIQSDFEEEFLRTIFVKPPRFSPEQENRIIFRAHHVSSLPAGQEPLLLKSRDLRKAIKRLGRVKQKD